jgi:hemerythrin
MFEWNDAYSVNLTTIDAQHKRLFRLAADLHRAMLAGAVKASLFQLLEDLVQYTVVHFAYEERLMQQAGYPEFAAHKAQHDYLAQRVREFQKDFEEGRIATGITLLQFLKEWMQDHIMESDHKYAPYLKARAVA